jgi:type I restriction enzyme S subunit
LYKVLRCQAFADYFTPDLTGVSVPHISPDQILAFPIPVPPLDEQRAIARFLQDEENSLAGMTQSCGQATALLKERRSALISAAVTGQIDVRGAVLQPAPLEGHAG